MFSLFRILQRSGGVLAISAGLLGLAFYGIALLSVAFVDDPARGLRILAVFFVLSALFCAMVVWTVRRALAHARRPLNSAYEATTKIASLGGKGGRNAYRFLGRKTATLGGFLTSAAALAGRAAARAGEFIAGWKSLGSRRSPNSPAPKAEVIPMHRSKRSKKSGMI